MTMLELIMILDASQKNFYMRSQVVLLGVKQASPVDKIVYI